MGYLWGKPQERPADEPEQPQSLAQSIPPEERAAVMEFLASFVNQKDAISQMSKEELLARREALLTGNGTAPPGVQPSTEELVRIAKGGGVASQTLASHYHQPLCPSETGNRTALTQS